MADHDDQNDDQEDGQLLRDGSFISQCAEGTPDQYGQDRDHELCNNAQNDLLELLQDSGNQSALIPCRGKAYQHGEEKGGHDRHDLGNGQFKEDLRQFLQAVHFGADMQERQDGKTCCGGKCGSADGRNIGDAEGHDQHLRSIVSQSCDGRCNKTDDDKRYTEADELTADELDSHKNVEQCACERRSVRSTQCKTGTDADSQCCQKPERQAVKKTSFFHFFFLPLQLLLLFFQTETKALSSPLWSEDHPFAICVRSLAATSSHSASLSFLMFGSMAKVPPHSNSSLYLGTRCM